MNKKEISELRSRLQLDKNAISCIRGCYVNDKREVVSVFDYSLMSLPQEEAEKYLALFKRTLAGVPAKNLIDVDFSVDQVMDSEEHRLLMEMRNTALKDEDIVNAFYLKVIESLVIDGNYLILLMHDSYDVPFRGRDDVKVDDTSEEVFSYILCSICPVKLTKPALSYFAVENEFHSREIDRIVASPEVGFIFPRFDDRASNIYGALYFTRDAANTHEELIDAVFHAEMPMPAVEQKETFQSVLEEALEDEMSLEVVQTVHEQLRERLEEHNTDKTAEPLTISRNEVKNVLESCGVSEEHVAKFEEKYDEQFGLGMGLTANNIVDAKKFELRTPDVVIKVNPERSDLVETRMIDGSKYILIRADEGVEVNGVNIRIGQKEQ